MRGGIATVIVLVVAAPAPGSDAVAELQGRWELVSVEAEGKADAVEGARPRVEIVGDKFRYGGEDLASISAEPDATPKAIDLRFHATMRVYEGVYAIEGDSLKVCLNRRTIGEKERPHRFATKGKEGWRLLAFRRVRKGEGDGASGLRGFVGVALEFDKDRKVLVVACVPDGTPAAKAGLKVGDVVQAIGGTPVTGLEQAVEEVRRAAPGRDLAFRVRRDGKEKEIAVRVTVLPFTAITDLEC